MKSILRFWKMTGAGNDFVVLDARDGLAWPADVLARALCPRRTAVGADGLLCLTAADAGRVVVDYRNADGSTAGFCGNGARCIARFAAEHGLARPPFEVVFPSLTVRAQVDRDCVELEGPRPQRLDDIVDAAAGAGAPLLGRRIVAGVEHVVFGDAPPDVALPALVERVFAARPDLAGRVNVTVVRRAPERTLHVRTYERGVGETLACGSAALAAAAFAAGDADEALEFTVIPPAGVPLIVRLAAGGGPAVLRGEARFVYEGALAVEVLGGAG